MANGRREHGIFALALVLGLAFAGSARADGPRPDGRTYAVLVGVADYPRSPLPRTDVDAERIARALSAHVPDDRLRMRLLLNRDATYANVTRALADVAREATERDEVIFFFSGHGGTEPDQANGDEGDGVDETIVLYDRSLTDDELALLVRDLKSRFAIFAFDSCFSGGFLFDVTNARNRMGMFSSDEDLTSAVPGQEAGGWLSLYLAEALEGRADGVADGVAGQAQDGQLTALELELYVRERFARQQRIAASDPQSRTVGYQHIGIQRVGVAPDSVFMTFGGPVQGVERRVVLEQRGIALPGGGSFPSVRLALEVGHTYVIETLDLTGSTDTVLQLRRGSGAESDEVVIENDDGGESLASRVRFTVDRAGPYYAHVRPYSSATGGSFGLRVIELVEGSATPSTPSIPGVPSTSGALLERTNVSLPASGGVTFDVALEAGRAYTIETFDLTGHTDTVMQLVHDGRVLAENDDDGMSLASRIRFTPSERGTYTVRVRPYAPQTAGTFSLRVVESAATTPSTSSALLERTNVSLPASGDVTFDVALEAGRAYTIETFDLAGYTDTVMQLAHDGRVLAENDDDGMSLASRIRFTPSERGTYTVRVRPYAPQTAGTFSLRVLDAR